MSHPLGSRPLDTDFLVRCRCGKVRSDSLKEAKRKRRRAAKSDGSINAVRYYQCDHGWWHWTSMLAKPAAVTNQPI